MTRASLTWLLVCLTATACSNPDSGGLDTEYTSSTGTTDTGESGDAEESGDGETDTGTDTDTEDPEALRFIAVGSHESVVLALDLDDPHDVPGPQYIATGTDIAALFGPTPFGTEIVTHDGSIDQLHLSPEGELWLSPFVSKAGNWLTNVWFGDEGANALVSTSSDQLTGPNVLLWARYDEAGEAAGSYDFTPQIQPGGIVLIVARSPDSRWSAALVDTQPNGFWDLYLLPIDSEPGLTVHVDTVDLTGIASVSVPSFLSLHLDNERVVYRRELLEGIKRPVAVGLDNPDANPVSIGLNLNHTYSITPADNTSRLLVTTGGGDGYHELRLIELDGPTSALPPVLITEPDAPALENVEPALDVPTHGHGFDALGRIYYVYGNSSLPETKSAGINLVTVTDGVVVERLDIADVPLDGEIDDVVFDAELQLLGYRVQTTNLSSIHYIDLSAEQPESIIVDQIFEHAASAPADDANFGWSASGSHIAVVGLQQELPILYVAEIGDASGATVEIELPHVEATAGFSLDHRPMVSPSGDQVLLWYGTQAGRTGLIHAPTDGSAMGEVVLQPQHKLSDGTFMPRVPQ